MCIGRRTAIWGAVLVLGINHLTLAVRDLDLSVRFYVDLLGLKLRAQWNRGAYLTAGTAWITLTLDSDARDLALPEYTHFAFTVRQCDFQEISDRVRGAQVRIWQENHSPGDSLYFMDPNGHKLEIHTSSLSDRLAEFRSKPPNGLRLYD
jgi:glutathione S-transferase fosA5